MPPFLRGAAVNSFVALEKGDKSTNVPDSIRLRAGLISLVVAIALLGVKFLAWRLTGSAAVLSDALESIVNVVAAAFAVVSLAIASRPADASHPYGHGKVEFLSSGFEGGLIAFAALLILYGAGTALVSGNRLNALDRGVALVGAAGIGNLLLGVYLLRTGRRTRSPTLEADGHHVLSDFWTSAGVVTGLVAVWLTGWEILDPLVAIGVGVHLGFIGASLLRGAIGGLLDETDPKLLAKLAAAINQVNVPGIIAIHRLRAIRSGGKTHIDAHLVVPRFWSVSQAHEAAHRFEEEVVRRVDEDASFIFHLDPCRNVYCPTCVVEPCPVRGAPFVARREWTIEELTGDPPPDLRDHAASRVAYGALP
jgi:cation diffusion facilitator family transporter